MNYKPGNSHDFGLYLSNGIALSRACRAGSYGHVVSPELALSEAVLQCANDRCSRQPSMELKSRGYLNRGVFITVAFFALFVYQSKTHVERILAVKNMRRLQNERCAANGRRCVVYDRPFRTGSTTIDRTLGICMDYKGYVGVRNLRDDNRTNGIHYMLGFSELNRSSVRPHIFMNRKDHDGIMRGCDCLLYVTSTARMADRVISHFKYNLIEGHGNFTYNLHKLNKLVNRHLKGRRQRIHADEEKYTNYPYVKEKVSEYERIVPQYVIRKEYLAEDLTALLNALDCGGLPIFSDNIHSTSSMKTQTHQVVIGKLRTAISKALRTNDYRFQKLSKLAETRNRFGLRAAAYF